MSVAPRLTAVPPAPAATEPPQPAGSEEARTPLGQLLIEAGQIGRDDLEKALAFQASYGGRLGSILRVNDRRDIVGGLKEQKCFPFRSYQVKRPGRTRVPGELSGTP